ncbi:MerR family transcriptional regulator [Actinomadura craniellae]|uniref:MerR family transcriptional regulator n=1 Tax=Actinomadura craniellae TaxID=2231787 RepID=A0A365HAT2_9ACTN|nr:MerR family transcriptional regulator [Actinomadura craniellae]RAY16207.1 MerR family transcriptional regulator [Actinomadura craniellae]
MTVKPSTTGRGTRERALRPIDLARLVGVSAQQIRNYVDAGVLPPTERTPAGYRKFDGRHRAALITYRALAQGYGWDTARSIMQAVNEDDPALALALVNAGHAALHERRLSLHAAGEALEAIAGQSLDASAVPHAGLRVGEVAGRLGVRTSALRLWEAAGLLAPRREPATGYRRYGPADVRDARVVHLLRQGRYPVPQIKAVLDGLHRTGSTEALRAVIAERQATLTRTGVAMLEADGHLHGYIAAAPPGSASASFAGGSGRDRAPDDRAR